MRAALLLALLSLSCATHVGVEPGDAREVGRELSRNAVGDGEPSIETIWVLNRRGLADAFGEDPVGTIRELHSGLESRGELDRLFALSELSYLHAERSRDRSYFLAAAVYAASEGLRTLVLERDAVGGQAGSSSLIRNYLGFPRGVSGADLSDRAYQQAWVFGAQFAHTREAVGLEVPGSDGAGGAGRDGSEGFLLHVAGGGTVRAGTVVLADGVSYRRLAVPGLDPFVGSAVFYGVSVVEANRNTSAAW